MDNELWNGQVRINKDILKYSDQVFLGLSLKQTVFGGLSIAVAVGVFAVTKSLLGLPKEISLFICTLFAAPLAAFGFLNYNGMSFLQLFVAIIQHLKMKTFVVFKSHSYFLIQKRKTNGHKEKTNAKNIQKY